MYVKVETIADFNIFNQIWMDCWLEKGYMLEPSLEEKSDRFILRDVEKRSIGTIEFKPYYTTFENNINNVYPFHKLQHIASNPKQVVEIDKVAILREYRGKNLERLISLYVSYTEFHKIEYCVGLVERLFYKALRNVYKVPLEAVGEQTYYKGDHVIPAVLYPSLIYKKKVNYPWLTTVKPEFTKIKYITR
ncbi:hypothetical protein DS745_05705 [Anaerobacillus alkaliphilus]|uniref:GNAT family N-acetyltransferase n=1 Tax=Anaerobacillus alkaliphilus TaxID=1548597 RepID=A0A4Q0VY80_9BACI|nr:hypothetical protein [Anaerobacillus alkaliphilus]RXJ02804.1 hypothetical protein DS745_05705 [Anaerobacillus alkaliphilus]